MAKYNQQVDEYAKSKEELKAKSEPGFISYSLKLNVIHIHLNIISFFKLYL